MEENVVGKFQDILCDMLFLVDKWQEFIYLKYIVLFGLIGVGKIIMLVKFVVIFMFEKQKKIVFIIIDMYWIVVVEQLKIYVELLQVFLEVCYIKEEFQQVKELFFEYDYVFIDIVGRNFKEQ